MSQVPLIHIIGAGHLGSAILGGLLSNGFPKDRLCITDHNRDRQALIAQQLGVSCYKKQPVDVTILAVKPDQLKSLSLPKAYKSRVLVSVMAGIALQTLQNHFRNYPIIRAMPNLAAFYGQSATCILAQGDQESLQLTSAIFEKIGQVVLIEDEQKMHLATALVGSGPAFWLKLMEAFMVNSDDTTKQMVIASCRSALCLAEKTQDSFSAIAKSIASPQGTTEKGLLLMEELNIAKQIHEIIHSTEKRSQEIENLSAKS